MADERGTLSFASWVRRGLGAAIERKDGPVLSPAVTDAAIDLTIAFKGTVIEGTSKLTLVGPGDIVGLDSRVVVRLWPKRDENDAEFENLALIEFDQADLPWRYTPARANDQDRLRPWINLVVVDEAKGKIIAPTPALKLAQLDTNTSELPDLTLSWAWAHTQFEGAGLDENIAAAQMRGKRGLFASRIICPRRLEANKQYIACLVPTFKRGVIIGTGGKPGDTDDALALAWDKSQGDVQVKLPVYSFWRFQTGSTGSFEQLARLIVPQPLPSTLGRRKMDVHDPGLGLPRAAEESLEVEGALQSVEAATAGPSPWEDPERANWITKLEPFINEFVPYQGTNVRFVVAPPLYARWYAAKHRVDAPPPTGTTIPWFFELNVDPRNRVGAGLGTLVVQNEQQALMASAWKQVGELDAINDRLRVAQLGRMVVSRMFERHILTGFDDTLWTVTSTLHPFIDCGGKSICNRFDASPVDRWIFDPAWRRISRPLGRLGRRQGQASLGQNVNSNLIDRLNRGQGPAPDPAVPGGLFTRGRVFRDVAIAGLPIADIDKLRTLSSNLRLFWGLVLLYVGRKWLVERGGNCWWLALKAMRVGIALIRMSGDDRDIDLRTKWVLGQLTCADIQAAPKAPNFAPVNEIPSTIPMPPLLGGPNAVDTADAAAFRTALCKIADIFGPPKVPPDDPGTPIDLSTCRISLREKLHPAKTILDRFRRLLIFDPAFKARWNPRDELEPVQSPPEYEEPMYRPLSEISKDWIVPGLGEVSRNSAGIAMTNQRFVEAYMAGLNDEMTRELLWNQFPTDQRGTYFRQFWDIAGIVPAEGATPERDILPLASWRADRSLGGNMPNPNGAPTRLVLLLRAQLIQRYPNVIVYAQKAVAGTGGERALGVQETHPSFYGLLEPDVAFYGFDGLTVPDVRGDLDGLGWFFILQEQPGEPKFEPHDSNGNPLPPAPPGPAMTPPPGSTAAKTAQLSYRNPFRLAMHGSMLVAPQP